MEYREVRFGYKRIRLAVGQRYIAARSGKHVLIRSKCAGVIYPPEVGRMYFDRPRSAQRALEALREQIREINDLAA